MDVWQIACSDTQCQCACLELELPANFTAGILRGEDVEVALARHDGRALQLVIQLREEPVRRDQWRAQPSDMRVPQNARVREITQYECCLERQLGCVLVSAMAAMFEPLPEPSTLRRNFFCSCVATRVS